TWMKRRNLTFMEGPLRCLGFTPDGKHLVITLEAAIYEVQIVDPETNEKQSFFQGHKAPVQYAAFSQDGKRIVTAEAGAPDKAATACVWDPATGKEIKRYTHPRGLYGVALSPDGSKIFACGMDSSIREFDVDSGEEKVLHPGPTPSFVFATFS